METFFQYNVSDLWKNPVSSAHIFFEIHPKLYFIASIALKIRPGKQNMFTLTYRLSLSVGQKFMRLGTYDVDWSVDVSYFISCNLSQ